MFLSSSPKVGPGSRSPALGLPALQRGLPEEGCLLMGLGLQESQKVLGFYCPLHLQERERRLAPRSIPAHLPQVPTLPPSSTPNIFGVWLLCSGRAVRDHFRPFAEDTKTSQSISLPVWSSLRSLMGASPWRTCVLGWVGLSCVELS